MLVFFLYIPAFLNVFFRNLIIAFRAHVVLKGFSIFNPF